jgi:preprotein translocase subunit SecD
MGFIILVILASCGASSKENTSLTDSQKSTITSTPVPCLTTGTVLALKVKPSQAVSRITTEIQVQVQKVLQNRIKGLGIADAVVQSVGEDRLEIFLPGNVDLPDVSQVIGNLAQLELRPQKIGAEAQLSVELEVHRQLLAKQDIARKSGNSNSIVESQKALQQNNRAISNLFEPTKLTGGNVSDASAVPQFGDTWGIKIQFDARGSKEFAKLTKNLAGTGRGLGIFVDDLLISSPVVSAEYAKQGIQGGSAVISGNFTPQQANDLALQIRAGALPPPVEIVSTNTFKKKVCQTPEKS